MSGYEELVRAFDHRHPFRTLSRLLAPRRKTLLAAFLLYGIKHSPIWLLPVITADVIDVLVQQRPVERLWIDGLILAGLVAQNLPVNIAYSMKLSSVLRDLEVRLRSALSQRVQDLSIGFWNRMNIGSLQSKVVRDVENIELALRQAGNGGFAAIYNFVGAITITALRVPEFLIFFLFVVPTSGWVMVITRKRLNERNEEFRASVERMAVRTTEMMGLVPVARAHGLERTALANVRDEYESTRRAGLSLDFMNSSFGALSWVVYNLANAACLITAVWAGRTGRIDISAGEVVMLTGYFNVLAAAVIMLTDLAPNFARGVASIRSIAEVLEAEDVEPNHDKAVAPSLTGELSFNDVSFSYGDDTDVAISNVTFSVKPGQFIALAGPSGAGKSTMANLLIGFVRPTAGRIMFDGIDAETLDYRTVRSQMSVVPQDPVMFDGTVRENVCYGSPEISDEDLDQALLDANAAEFVAGLPDGVDTEIGPRGYTLSGGQKQRLAIARAMIRNPRILVLDEATSALDTESELLVQQAMTRLMAGRTTFVIAHRLSTIRDADCIYVMDKGVIVESGRHEDLVNANGLYSRLHAGAES